MTKEEFKRLDDLALSAALSNLINEARSRDLVGPYDAQARSLAGFVQKIAMARYADNLGSN